MWIDFDSEYTIVYLFPFKLVHCQQIRNACIGYVHAYCSKSKRRQLLWSAVHCVLIMDECDVFHHVLGFLNETKVWCMFNEFINEDFTQIWRKNMLYRFQKTKWRDCPKWLFRIIFQNEEFTCCMCHLEIYRFKETLHLRKLPHL